MPVLSVETEPAAGAGGKSGKAAVLHQGHAQLQGGLPLHFKEACRYTGLSDSQLYKLTKAGKVPHYKPSGKLLFFSKRELDGWLCRNHEIGELPCLDEVSEIELKGMSV